MIVATTAATKRATKKTKTKFLEPFWIPGFCFHFETICTSVSREGLCFRDLGQHFCCIGARSKERSAAPGPVILIRIVPVLQCLEQSIDRRHCFRLSVVALRYESQNIHYKWIVFCPRPRLL